MASIDLWNKAKKDLLEYIQKIFQYKRLKNFEFEHIIDYCFQLDISKVIPTYKDDIIINLTSLK